MILVCSVYSHIVSSPTVMVRGPVARLHWKSLNNNSAVIFWTNPQDSDDDNHYKYVMSLLPNDNTRDVQATSNKHNVTFTNLGKLQYMQQIQVENDPLFLVQSLVFPTP